METETQYRLTEYSRGAGCGCKISPQVLREIIASGKAQQFQSLIVGNESNDDAAVIDTGAEKLLIATTDFFMPVVDDAFDFGRVAAANAISDVYAMGGKPLLALAILGWPIDKLPANVAARVLEGGRAVCAEVGIPLAGGHTIDSAEPIFGLVVNGLVDRGHLKHNNTAKAGDSIFITKPLGSGILSTALKRAVITDGDKDALIRTMTTLNKVGEKLGKIAGVHAMTDVTGFGLLGHLIEMTQGGGLSADLRYGKIRLQANLQEYLKQNIVPDATYRNWNSYQKQVAFAGGVPMPEAFQVLPDPQTNGGLLLAVDPKAVEEVQKVFEMEGLGDFAVPIGKFTAGDPGIVRVND